MNDLKNSSAPEVVTLDLVLGQEKEKIDHPPVQLFVFKKSRTGKSKKKVKKNK